MSNMEFRETRISSRTLPVEEQKGVTVRESAISQTTAAAPESAILQMTAAAPESAILQATANSENCGDRTSAATRRNEAAASLLHLSGIVEESIVDGPGIRFVVFTQGCPHHCPGCHNPGTHSFTGGYEVSVEELLERYQENPLLTGITFSGGEPFCQPAPLARLGAIIHKLGGDVITYTGFLYEDLLEHSESDEGVRALLKVTDLLVDGPYIEAERSLALAFRGSKNQRLIHLKEGKRFYEQTDDSH